MKCSILKEETYLCVNSKKYGKFVLLIDAADAERIAKHQWCLAAKKKCIARDTFYFWTSIRHLDGRRGMSLHRFIKQAPNNIQVDHARSNYLDVRKAELRLASPAQNSRNQRKHKDGSSRFKGVCHDKSSDKWYVQIKHNGRNVHLGYFPPTPEGEIDAAKVYDRKAVELFGEFAKPNFPHQNGKDHNA